MKKSKVRILRYLYNINTRSTILSNLNNKLKILNVFNFFNLAISTRSDPGQRSGGSPDISMPSRNSPILHQNPIHQQSPQMNGGTSNVIGLREKPALYGASPSAISRPAWKWWRYLIRMLNFILSM